MGEREPGKVTNLCVLASGCLPPPGSKVAKPHAPSLPSELSEDLLVAGFCPLASGSFGGRVVLSPGPDPARHSPRVLQGVSGRPASHECVSAAFPSLRASCEPSVISGLRPCVLARGAFKKSGRDASRLQEGVVTPHTRLSCL